MPGGRSLRPVKNKGRGNNIVDQNFPPIFTSPYFQSASLTKNSAPIFHWAIYTFNKTPLFLFRPPIFKSALFFIPPIFYFPPIFSICTFNKNLSLFSLPPYFSLGKLHP